MEIGIQASPSQDTEVPPSGISPDWIQANRNTQSPSLSPIFPEQEIRLTS